MDKNRPQHINIIELPTVANENSSYLEIIRASPSNEVYKDSHSNIRTWSNASDEYVIMTAGELHPQASVETYTDDQTPRQSNNSTENQPPEGPCHSRVMYNANTDVIVEENCSYNALMHHSAQPKYSTLTMSSQVYEEIPAELRERVVNASNQPPLQTEASIVVATKRAVSPGRALWSFGWQGKVEIVIRIANMALGASLFVLLLAAIANAGRVFNFVLTGTENQSRPTFTFNRITVSPNQITPTPVYIVISVWILFLMFSGTVEVFLFVARLYISSKVSKCILIWDIVHSIVLYVFYLVSFAELVWLTSAWSAFTLIPTRSTDGNIVGQLSLFAICTIVGFLYAGSYMLKAGWIIAFLNQKWEKKMEEYIQSQST